jgi:hypothetical protein
MRRLLDPSTRLSGLAVKWLSGVEPMVRIFQTAVEDTAPAQMVGQPPMFPARPMAGTFRQQSGVAVK